MKMFKTVQNDILLLGVLSVFLFVSPIPTALACRVMGEPSKNNATPEKICRGACGFFGGWTGKADNHLADGAFPYVDCYCDNQPADGLC